MFKIVGLGLVDTVWAGPIDKQLLSQSSPSASHRPEVSAAAEELT